tara:strand:- start:1888 stop:2550 length:663 start_codon:yes stop_codon:yes gene_type:complete
MLGVTLGNAGITVTNLIGDFSPQVSASYSNLSTNRGLATREDSFAYSILVGLPVEDAELSLGIDLHDVDGDFEKDWSVAYARPVKILGQGFGAKAYFERIDSSHGDWEEVGLSLTYSHDIADLTTTVWHQVDTDDAYGVEFMVSHDLASPVKNLSLTPFIAVNVANGYNAVEAGVSATHDFGNGLSLFLKGAYNHNDLDSSDAYALESDWSFGAGASFKF